VKKETKTKQQLLLEMEALRTRLGAREQRFQGTHETLQALAQKYAESIVETVREPLVVLASGISANRSFYETFHPIARRKRTGTYKKDKKDLSQHYHRHLNEL
jgi:hypothetical protein